MKYVPNAISLLRILAAVGVLVLMLKGFVAAACVTLLVAALSDAVDGAIARRWDVESELGKRLEPIADLSLTIFALVALLIVGAWPSWIIAPLIGGALVLQAIGWSQPKSKFWQRVKRVQSWLHPLLFIALLVVIGLYYVLLATHWNIWFVLGYLAVVTIVGVLKRNRLADFRPA